MRRLADQREDGYGVATLGRFLVNEEGTRKDCDTVGAATGFLVWSGRAGST